MKSIIIALMLCVTCVCSSAAVAGEYIPGQQYKVWAEIENEWFSQLDFKKYA